MQIELLHHRFAQQQKAAWETVGVDSYRGAVLDRSLPGDRVFCRMHMHYGNIDPLEWATYERAFDVMVHHLAPPSLVLFLDVAPEVALERVRKRARGAEVGIDIEYLRDLYRGYMDLLAEIESGRHAWSQGMRVHRVPWNTDHLPIEPLVEDLKQEFRL